jgi:hypothetical protein
MCDSTFLFDRVECLDTWKATYVGRIGKVMKPTEFLAEVSVTRLG